MTVNKLTLLEKESQIKQWERKFGEEKVNNLNKVTHLEENLEKAFIDVGAYKGNIQILEQRMAD